MLLKVEVRHYISCSYWILGTELEQLGFSSAVMLQFLWVRYWTVWVSVYGSDWEKSSQLSASRSHHPALELCSTNACMWMCCARSRYMQKSGCTERKENTEDIIVIIILLTSKAAITTCQKCHFVTSILKYRSPWFLLTYVSARNIMFPHKNSTFHCYHAEPSAAASSNSVSSNTSMLEYIIWFQIIWCDCTYVLPAVWLSQNEIDVFG